MAKEPTELEKIDKSALRDQVAAAMRADLDAVLGVDVTHAQTTAQLGSVVDVQEDDGRRVRYFILPAGSGIVVGKSVSAAAVITPDSAVGRALIGKHEGDNATVT